ncbi:MAG: C25 family cysteine peptidase [Cyclobacteriaceae bacterium]
MMRRSSYITIIVVLLSFSAKAQFGIEWIDFNQSYYKLEIIKSDFYRVTQAELTAAGFPVASVPASRVQLFRKGVEVAINVNSNPDGTLNYLEFFGEAISGVEDSPLYELGDQPHSLYNLFSDTASYFLTYKLGAESGKRIAFSSDQDASGLTAEPFHYEESSLLYTSDYASGFRFGTKSAFSLSKYDFGEGWTGALQGKGVFTDHNFTLTNRVAGQVPVCDFVLSGRNSLSHNAVVSAGPNTSSLATIGSTQFNGWGSMGDSFSVPETSIGGAGELAIRLLTEGFDGATDFLSVSYMRVRYAQDLVAPPTENKIFTLGDPSSTKAYLQIGATTPSSVSIYDIADPTTLLRIATANFSNRVDAVIPNPTSGHKILAVTNPSSVPSIRQVPLTQPGLAGKNYLIITHPTLRASGDPVADVKSYRESTVGGNYSVLVTEVQELFDLFNYGDPSPLAIRNFVQYAASQTGVEYIFIIGKGFTPNLDYYRGDQSVVNIPTFGLPGSDLMYTLGINADPVSPGIPIGRLNAFQSIDVTNYLTKLIEMEATPFDKLWRKDFLQLSGGNTPNELSQFAANIQSFATILEKDFLGGRAFNTGKETGEAVEFVDVTDRINEGVGYVTFFGHSGGGGTDIEIGFVSDPQFGFANKGKYPVFLVNGCKAGEIFGNNLTFGEDWLTTPDLGAVGFIAHADFATGSTLRRWSNLFYELAYADDVFIEESVGNILIEVSKRYIAQNGTSNSSLTQVQQMLYEGDPAYRIFGADEPDYQIDASSLFAEATVGSEILATQDSFKLNIVVKNFGRSVLDSLRVQIDRTLPDGTLVTYLDKFERPLRLDTLEFIISNDQTQNNTGQNLFSVRLDPLSETPELDKTNNVASIEFPIFSGNTSHLYPRDNSTVASKQVEFIWQSSNLLERERSFDLEFDTENTFSTPNRRSTSITGELLLRSEFDFSQFSLPDSTTVYWRTRLSDPDPDETNNWVTTSFTIIDAISGGWGQYEPTQIETGVVTGVEYNPVTSRWEFVQSTTAVAISTFGADNLTLLYEDIEAIISGTDFMVTSAGACFTDSFNAIAFDKESGNPYRPIQTSLSDLNNTELCGRLPQMIYNFQENDILVDGRLQVLVDNMRDGDQIILYSIGDVTYSNWDAAVEATLNSLGISSATISTLTDGQPVIFLGRKGDAPGSALEVVNNGSADPITEQEVQLQNNVSGSFTSGTIKTQRIGPVLDWSDFSFNLTEEANDTYAINVFGVDQNGVATTFPEFERSRAETIDVSTIDPLIYPEIELEFTFSDELDLTPPQLNLWQINYAEPPEGIIISENKSVSSFQEGEEIGRDLAFYNYSKLDFTDSLDVEMRLINQNTGNVQTESIKIAAPLADDSVQFSTSFPSLGYSGMNSLVMNIKANENEAYDFNNHLTLGGLIEVEADETNPVLDVTFDGSHILDGDIISPTPNIAIRMRDENMFLFKGDTSGINLSLRLPGEESQFQRVNFSEPSVSFTVASETQDFEISYEPGQLADGLYGFRVDAEDASGNDSGTEPYEVTFEVINESTITHFYPYPNPFSTSCRFVFTLTGNEIPDQLKIQILTVSGRVVREILQSEIGPIKIGNNITEYAWDGRDEYGDQLANGVYFYKVFVNSNGQGIDQRATNADGAFKHGFGKLYILR